MLGEVQQAVGHMAAKARFRLMGGALSEVVNVAGNGVDQTPPFRIPNFVKGRKKKQKERDAARARSVPAPVSFSCDGGAGGEDGDGGAGDGGVGDEDGGMEDGDGGDNERKDMDAELGHTVCLLL